MSMQLDDPKVQVSSHSRVPTMPEMPSSNSTVTTGKEEPSKFERTDTPTLVVGSKVVRVVSVEDSAQEVDTEVAMEQEVEALAAGGALVVGEGTEEDLEVAVDSKVVLEGEAEDLVVSKAEDTEVLLRKPPLPTPSLTSPPVVVSAAKSSLCET